MRIAVTSANFQTISGHAGHARRFLVYDVDSGGVVHEQSQLDLPPEQVIHEYQSGEHPLFALNLQALITKSAGQGFMQKLAQQGIIVHITGATDPLGAATQVATGQPLQPADPNEHMGKCTCQHKH